MKLELIYIGEQQSRFKKGMKYNAVSFTTSTTVILDKDDIPMEFYNDNLHHHFRSIQSWREEQINKVLNEKN